MGIAVGVASVLVLTGIRRLAGDRRTPGPLGMPALLLAGGLAVGALALAAGALGADTRTSCSPAGVDRRCRRCHLDLDPRDPAPGQGSGLRREPRVRLPRRADLPAIFIGVALASLPVAAFGTSPTLAVAVGAAAGMAAQTRLLLSPLLLASLLVGPTATDTIPAASLPRHRRGSERPRSSGGRRAREPTDRRFSRRSRLDETGFVRGHDGLHPVPALELHQDPATCVLTVPSDTTSRLAISAFDRARAISFSTSNSRAVRSPSGHVAARGARTPPPAGA